MANNFVIYHICQVKFNQNLRLLRCAQFCSGSEGVKVEENGLGNFVCGICYFLNIKNIPKSVFKPEFTGKRLEI